MATIQKTDLKSNFLLVSGPLKSGHFGSVFEKLNHLVNHLKIGQNFSASLDHFTHEENISFV
jgi:hypothetical protein